MKIADSENRPKYIIFAGCNGCGKSTLYHSCSNTFPYPRVNSDEAIKSFNGDWRNRVDRIKADRLTVGLVREYFSKHITFCQETTLCGKSIIRNIANARNEGYDIWIYYVGVADVEGDAALANGLNGVFMQHGSTGKSEFAQLVEGQHRNRTGIVDDAGIRH